MLALLVIVRKEEGLFPFCLWIVKKEIKHFGKDLKWVIVVCGFLHCFALKMERDFLGLSSKEPLAMMKEEMNIDIGSKDTGMFLFLLLFFFFFCTPPHCIFSYFVFFLVLCCFLLRIKHSSLWGFVINIKFWSIFPLHQLFCICCWY